MAIQQTVYSPIYPNNTKTITVDLVTRIPTNADGDEKYIIYVYPATNAYSNATARTTIDPIYMYELRRGWAQSHVIATPITTNGGTLTLAIDEDPTGEVTVTVTSGTWSSQQLCSSLQQQVQLMASGVKSTASNKLSYRNAMCSFEDGRITFLSGSTKSYYNSADWSATSSVLVTGGTIADELGFYSGYPNSYDIATTASGQLHGPASAHVSIDDAIRYAVMAITSQIDFSG